MALEPEPTHVLVQRASPDAPDPQLVESALSFFDLGVLGKGLTLSRFTADEGIGILIAILRDEGSRPSDQISAWRELRATFRESAKASGYLREVTTVGEFQGAGPSGSARVQLVERATRVAQEATSLTERMLREAVAQAQLEISEDTENATNPEGPTNPTPGESNHATDQDAYRAGQAGGETGSNPEPVRDPTIGAGAGLFVASAPPGEDPE